MIADDYQSFADAWEGRATIRTRPRRIIENDENSSTRSAANPWPSVKRSPVSARTCAISP